MAGIGFKSLFTKEFTWTLTSLDDDTVVRGQYQPEGMQKDVGSNYAESKTTGRAQPIRQFDSEEADTISFTARTWAAHEGLPGAILGGISDAFDQALGRLDSIENLYEVIELLPRKIPSLGRPRIWVFSVGSTRALEMTCTVDSVGSISFARLRSGGDLRGVTFNLTLTRFEEYDVSLNGRQNLSLVIPVLQNDSYESLSRRVYGNATSGEALRRRNPTKATPQVGDMIHIPPQSVLTLGYSPEPQAPVLKRTTAEEIRRREHQKKRSKTYRSFFLGPEWDEV